MCFYRIAVCPVCETISHEVFVYCQWCPRNPDETRCPEYTEGSQHRDFGHVEAHGCINPDCRLYQPGHIQIEGLINPTPVHRHPSPPATANGRMGAAVVSPVAAGHQANASASYTLQKNQTPMRHRAHIIHTAQKRENSDADSFQPSQKRKNPGGIGGNQGAVQSSQTQQNSAGNGGNSGPVQAPARQFRPWTPEEEQSMLNCRASGMSHAQVAGILDRTEFACQTRFSMVTKAQPKSQPLQDNPANNSLIINGTANSFTANNVTANNGLINGGDNGDGDGNDDGNDDGSDGTEDGKEPELNKDGQNWQ